MDVFTDTSKQRRPISYNVQLLFFSVHRSELQSRLSMLSNGFDSEIVLFPHIVDALDVMDSDGLPLVVQSSDDVFYDGMFSNQGGVVIKQLDEMEVI